MQAMMHQDAGSRVPYSWLGACYDPQCGSVPNVGVTPLPRSEEIAAKGCTVRACVSQSPEPEPEPKPEPKRNRRSERQETESRTRE